jgi:uncharacterized membrane protein
MMRMGSPSAAPSVPAATAHAAARSRSSAMPNRGFGQFLRSTLVGGVIFLMPILLLLVLLRYGIKFATKLAKPILALLPDDTIMGIAMADLIAVVILLGLALAAGMFARTGPGQAMLQWLQNSILGTLPQFNFVRGIAEGVGGVEDKHVEVVLVPTDAGLNFGFVFAETAGDIVPVFIPGAPDWTSGAVAFVARADMRASGVGFVEAIKILRKLGVGSDKVIAAMSARS